MNAKIVVAVALLGVAIGFGAASFRKSMTPYVSFDEARRSSGTVQVNGVLADRSLVLDAGAQVLEFRLRDSRGQVMTVEYRGVVPANFDQATAVVAIGRYADGRFRAEQLLVKCPSKYQTAAEKRRPAA